MSKTINTRQILQRSIHIGFSSIIYTLHLYSFLNYHSYSVTEIWLMENSKSVDMTSGGHMALKYYTKV